MRQAVGVALVITLVALVMAGCEVTAEGESGPISWRYSSDGTTITNRRDTVYE